jgi:hydroxymethylpyrimidine/phosphomethylpyrimidine kinase
LKQKKNPQHPIRGSKSSSDSPPVALTIAGSDSSAGAGIQADLKTFSALGVYGLTAVTCVVAEIPGKVSRIEAVSADLVCEQIRLLAKSFPIAAIKTGLLCSAEIISAAAEAIGDMNKMAGSRIPLVIDPVFVATSGVPLLESAGIQAYEKELFPLASVITPNLDEAGRLIGYRIEDQQSMRLAGKDLLRKYGTPILLKGGHLPGNCAIDLLFIDERVIEFSAPRAFGVATHGTGCTYSAAITAGLAFGRPLEEAIVAAKKVATKSIHAHFKWGDLHALNHSI